MLNIRKVLSIRVTSYMVLATFIFTNPAYSSTLRAPVGTEITEKRIWKALSEKRKVRYEEYGDPKGMPVVMIPGIDGITEAYTKRKMKNTPLNLS